MKTLVALILAAISIALMVYQAETRYQHFPMGTKWAQAFGFGIGPWLMGFLVAAIREGWVRIKGRKQDFSLPLLGVTGVVIAILIVGLVLKETRASGENSSRNDAMFLMGAALWIPGIAAICHKNVEPRPSLIDAAKKWTRRHNKDLELIVATLKATGGMSAQEKRQIDRSAFKLLKKEIASQGSKAMYCRQVEDAIGRGVLDLDKRDDTAPRLMRLRKFEP